MENSEESWSKFVRIIVIIFNFNAADKAFIWRKSHRSQITLSAEGISYNIARQVKLTPDAFGSLRHVRRILQVAAFEKCPQARKKD